MSIATSLSTMFTDVIFQQAIMRFFFFISIPIASGSILMRPPYLRKSSSSPSRSWVKYPMIDGRGTGALHFVAAGRTEECK